MFGVLVEVELGYYRTSTTHESYAPNETCELDDMGSRGGSPANQPGLRLVYTSYIRGMLTNLGGLPLDRIHNMLKMFADQDELKYTMSVHEIHALLQDLCRQEVIEVAGTKYQILS